MIFDYTHCEICPRRCGADRRSSRGYCGGGDKAVVAKIMLHTWEEPCISGTRGSGAVFFSGCNLRCGFCQNRDISFASKGKLYDAAGLSREFFALQAQGAHNINLVTATPYLPTVAAALKTAKTKGLYIPVVYNTGGYELAEAVDALGKLVDVYLPDFKYADGGLAEKYSRAADYPEIAARVIDRMVIQTGKPVIENGLIKRGVVIRHLMLPGHRDDSAKVVRTVAERWGGRVLISLMRQYTPEFASADCDLTRRVTSFEYNSVLKLATQLGLQGYFQDAESAKSAYTPDFGDK